MAFAAFALPATLLAGCAGESAANQPSANHTARASATPSAAVNSRLAPAGAPSTEVPSAPESPQVGPLAPAPLPGATPDAVAVAGVTALLSYDTAIDVDQNGAARRARRLLTADFAAAVLAYRPVVTPGAEWTSWAEYRARVRVAAAVGGDDHPADTPTTAWRQVIARLVPVGRDGWIGPSRTEVLFVTLSRTAGRWLIASATST